MKQYNKVLSHIGNLQKQLAEQEKAKPLPKEWNLKEALHENNTVHRFHRLADKGKEPQLEDWTELSQITEQYAPGFSRFIHQNGMLSERDTHICLLIISSHRKLLFSSALLRRPSPTAASVCSAKSLENKGEPKISMSTSVRWNKKGKIFSGSM